MSGFQGYDQWKTASPYDDEPDPIEEAQRFIEEMNGEVSIICDGEETRHPSRRKSDPEIDRACLIIEYLLNEI